MTEKEKIHMTNTLSNGVSNKNDPIWKKAFSQAYPTLSMDVDSFYAKVLSKIFSND